ncbi:hypothetical protein G9A89_021010 [Geosiphon pyriformis]|nr:hypothetical protein G9A89_021010 [Geosiphon pyriformis]
MLSNVEQYQKLWHIAQQYGAMSENMAHCSAIITNHHTEKEIRWNCDSGRLLKTTIKSLSIIQKTPQPKPSDINTQVTTKHQVTDFLFDLRPQIIISPTNKSTVAESESIRANYLEFVKFLFQHYCQHLELNHNQILAELAFNFYVNEKIVYLLRTPVNTELVRETFYHELIQNTSLSTNYNFASIITKINKEIKHHTQQRYPITYASKGKEKLQTPVVIPKQIQPPTWKKTRVKSPTNPSYHYTLRNTINITSTGASTSHVTLIFGQFSFQSKQRKEDLLRSYGAYFEKFKSQSPISWKVIELEEEQEEEKEESEDQKFTYQNPIPENLNIETLNF